VTNDPECGSLSRVRLTDLFGLGAEAKEADMAKIEALLNKASAAKKAVETELLRMYPAKSGVRFFISSAQRNESTGTVLCPGYQVGYLRVQHHQAKANSRYAYRDIHYTHLVGPL